MIPISKQEALYMREQGYAEYVKHTYSRHKHYFLVEQSDDRYRWNGRREVLVKPSAMRKLKEYRESIIYKSSANEVK